MDAHPSRLAVGSDSEVLFRRRLIFAGAFDPPTRFDCEVFDQLCALQARLLVEEPSVPVETIIFPVGAYAAAREWSEPAIRKELAQIAFGENYVNDYDLAHARGFTSTYGMQTLFSFEPRSDLKDKFMSTLYMPGVLSDVWHVINARYVDEIESWNEGRELWKSAHFLIVGNKRPTVMPPHSQFIEIKEPWVDIRGLIKARNPA
jgi:hypothetical protein